MKIKTDYIAIIIAVGSLIFTAYQWHVNIDSRRPRVRVSGFQPNHIFYSEELNFMRIYPPERWFIVNVSDIPITVMSMELFIKLGDKWREAKSICIHVDDEKLKDLLPISISGHTHKTFTVPKLMSGRGMFFQVDVCPQVEELKHLKVKIELEDHYGNVHNQVLTQKEIRSDKIEDFSWVAGFDDYGDYSKLLKKFTFEGADKKTYIIYVKYQSSYSGSSMFPRINVSFFDKDAPANPFRNKLNISCKDLVKWMEGKTKKRRWGNNDKDAYIRFEDKQPKYLELVFDNGGKPITKIIDLPEEFINSFKELITK